MTLTICTSVVQARAHLGAARQRGRRVAVVPTMGALHEGHLALVRMARQHGDEVVVTVFVNPTQFGPGEDFDRYPRHLDRDANLAERAGATVVFAPPTSEMYPNGEETRVRVPRVAAGLCGPVRPGHFEGVATVVSKLFNVLGEASYVFGRKDFQQLRLIQRMATDLLFPVSIVEHPIVRESDGLAMSSRNVYLSAEDRRRALGIPRALAASAALFAAGERRTDALLEAARGVLDRRGLAVEYVTLASPHDVSELPHGGTTEETVLLALAARSGATRLIDNIVLGVDAAPLVSDG